MPTHPFIRMQLALRGSLAMILLTVSASRGHAASANASAWGYQGSDAQSQLPTASAHLHWTGTDFPGYSDATSHARLGWMDGVSRMVGCGVNAPSSRSATTAARPRTSATSSRCWPAHRSGRP